MNYKMTRSHSKPWKIYRNDPCPCGSGRKYKHCCMRKRGKVSHESKDKGETLRVTVFGNDSSTDGLAFRAMFMGEGEEELAETLVSELVARGWSEKHVRDMWAQGARYNRTRDSLVLPPEMFGQWDDGWKTE